MGFSLGSLGSVVYDIVSQDKTKEGVDSAVSGAGKLDQKWNDMATTGLGVAGIAIGVGAAMWGTASRAADFADRLDDLSRTTGMSTDELQELRYISGSVGADFDGIATAAEMMTKNIGMGTPASKKALEELGVSVVDTAGKVRPTADIFRDIVDALGKVEDPMQRAALASELFGKQYKPVLELVGTSKEKWDDLAKAAHDAGLVIGEEDVKAMAEFKKSQNEVNMAMDTFWNELGLAVMPLLRELPGLLREVKPAIDAVAWVLRNFVAFNHLMSAGEKILTGDLEGAAKEFEIGRTISQGTAAQAATAGGGGGLSLVIQGDVKLSKDYPLTDFLKDADTAARNEAKQAGVPS
jgi:hypothetical protein